MLWATYNRDQYDLALMLRNNEDRILINTINQYDDEVETKNKKRKNDIAREEDNNRRKCETCKQQFTTLDADSWQKKCKPCYIIFAKNLNRGKTLRRVF